MKIKQLYQWQMINIKKSLYIFYTIIYAIYLFSILIFQISGNHSINGIDVSSSIYLFIVSMTFFGETFTFALCNGVSRKTMLITQAATTLSLTAAMTLIDMFNVWIFHLVGKLEDTSILYSIFRDASIISKIILTFSCYIMFAAFGYFIATLNSRLNKFAKMVLYIGIAILFIVGVPLGISTFSDTVKAAIGRFFSYFFSYLVSSPYNMMLIALIISVILYIFSILLVRKAPLKTA